MWHDVKYYVKGGYCYQPEDDSFTITADLPSVFVPLLPKNLQITIN